MSRLIALNIDSIKSYSDLKQILDNLGQRKSNFLLNIPATIENDLLAITKNFSDSESEKAKAIIHKLVREYGIIRNSNEKKSKDFNKKIENYYKKDKRLELAITHKSSPKPFISLDDIEEWPSSKPLIMEGGVSRYSTSDIDKICNFFEFYFRTASKIALVGWYNYIFDERYSKPTNLHSILLKIFENFQEKGCRCEEFVIYAAPNLKKFEDQKKVLNDQKEKIKNFLNELMKLKKIKYGIKYHILTDPKQRKKMHHRFIITSYSMFQMAGELSDSKNNNVITPISDRETIEDFQNEWLENDFKTDNVYVIKVND